MKRIATFIVLLHIALVQYAQIIADHTVVDKYDEIPQYYIDKVKEMWLNVPGESHATGYGTGLTLLEAIDPRYSVNVTTTGTPEGYTASHLRFSKSSWGNVDNATGWFYSYGEEDWFTSPGAIQRTKDGIKYCNTNDLEIDVIGFGWCWDMLTGSPTATYDPVYACRWWGSSVGGPEGSLSWGLDASDYSVTGNTVSMDTYLNATQQYIDYCKANGYKTKVFFTTGPVESYWNAEYGYQGHLKHEHIRKYVRASSDRILFDYADILCHDDDGKLTTKTWSVNTYPSITSTNLLPTTTGHISDAGAIRIAKALWWMLARMAGWDGISTGIYDQAASNTRPYLVTVETYQIRLDLRDIVLPVSVNLYNLRGNLIYSIKTQNSICMIDVSAYSSGIYLLELSNSEAIYYHKVFIK